MRRDAGWVTATKTSKVWNCFKRQRRSNSAGSQWRPERMSQSMNPMVRSKSSALAIRTANQSRFRSFTNRFVTWTNDLAAVRVSSLVRKSDTSPPFSARRITLHSQSTQNRRIEKTKLIVHRLKREIEQNFLRIEFHRSLRARCGFRLNQKISFDHTVSNHQVIMEFVF